MLGKARIHFLGDHSIPSHIVAYVESLSDAQLTTYSCDENLHTDPLIQNSRLSLTNVEWAIVDTSFIEIARRGGVSGCSKCKPQLKYHARFKSNFVAADALHTKLLETGESRYQRTRLVAISMVSADTKVQTMEDYKESVSLVLGYLNKGFENQAITA